MKWPLPGCLFVLIAFSYCGWAQVGRPSRGAFNSTTPALFPATDLTGATSTSAVFVSGKLVLDDGTALTEPATIQTICRGERHTEGYSDSHGGFSFQFGDPNTPGAISDAASAGAGSPVGMQARGDLQDCQIQASLAGFSSEVVELGRRMSQVNTIDVGRVSLHRLAHVDGSSISVTSALAPSAARKALEKARQEESKGKWNEAQKPLQKAVQVYPRYAVAWYELGRLQLRNQDASSAKFSFEQALAADAKYVNTYEGLAELAMLVRDWRAVADVTDKLLVLNPVNFPDAYYFNAAANYYMGNLDAAEKSATLGVRVDEGHQIPKLHYLLATILFNRHDYRAATEHMQIYLSLVRQPAEVELAKKALDEITRSASGGSAVVSENK